VNADPQKNLLNRLSIQELEQAARQSIEQEDFARANTLLREAIHRAPFRQDLRELLGAAIEGRIAIQGPASKRPIQSTLAAFRAGTAPTGRARTTPAQPSPPEGVSRALLRPVGPDEDEEETDQPAPDRAPRGRRLKPGQFERRHRRGPLSALLLGGIAGLTLLAVVVVAGWFYVQNHPAPGAGSDGGVERLRRQQVFEQASRYMQQKSFAMAIEQLESLPPDPVRDRRLAEIYIEIGDQMFQQQPPNLPAAREAYTHAVRFDPANADYGVALAQVHYSLTRGDNAAAADKDLDLARKTLQNVIDRNPDHLAAYDLLARVASAQRDYKLQQQALQKIIDISPPESEAARRAGDSLRSLGFKYDM
jgi:cytochrome c-type biogenesis protein CcmH/NrfG